MFAKSVCAKLIGLGLLQEDFLRQLPRYPNFLEGVLSWGVTYEALADLLQSDYDISSRRLYEGEISAGFAAELHPRMEFLIKKHMILPVSLSGNRLSLIMANPFDYVAADDVRVLTGCDVERVFADPQSVRRQISEIFGAAVFGGDAAEAPSPLTKTPSLKLRSDVQDSPAVRLLDEIVETAIRCFASDIHIEPFDTFLRVRHRIDGALVLYKDFDPSAHQGLMVRLKVISNLDTAEKRMPQDGHILSGIYSDKVDFRVSTIPATHGEKAVIRLIYSRHSKVDKHSLGFFPEDMRELERMFDPGPGAVIVTGPTGSGKTTTLAAFLNELNKPDINVVTIEDPVENDISGVNQININTKTGMGFAESLRAVLRQDPDVIMLGEIRDSETANVAMRAALTGHLLLTTLHTNDAVSCIARLTDMDVPGYIVSAVLKGVISQRLMRRLCDDCKKPAEVSAEDARVFGIDAGIKIYSGGGCGRCNNTGYKGRLAVYEYILADGGLRELIHEGVNAARLRRYLEEKGMKRIQRNALRNVLLGNSTVEEMYKVVYNAPEA
ncbi:MAG: GspE/PulE family protein [Defluviitaleaceae bacterium]|nr:GspE/PulE family protein [Defluviitaleaceae bacterium]